VITVALAVTFVGIAGYITWAHRQEYAAEQEVVRQHLSELDSKRERAPRERRPWRTPGKPLHL
jgi:hypothetical protein